MLRNHDDSAYFENRIRRCTSTYMSGASQKIQPDIFLTQVCAPLSAGDGRHHSF